MKIKKTQVLTLERIGIIASLIFSLISLILSIRKDVSEKTERIIILDGDETNYIFDGENLYKNICFAIANNSDISTSIVEINIKIDGENHLFNSLEDSFSPINMNSNETVKSNIPIPVRIDEVDKEFILNKYGVNCNIDVYELETYFKYGEDMQNIYNITYSPEINIKLKTSKGNEIKFYKEEYLDYESLFKYALDESGSSWKKLMEIMSE